jgi:hypothetical protein
MTIVRHCDLAASRFCNRGVRVFFERHGLDWSDFLKNGIDADLVRHIDDVMLVQALERAEQREKEGR